MRGRGGYIGTNVTPVSAAVNSAAGGVWTVREAESLKRAGTWPTAAFAPDSPTSLSGTAGNGQVSLTWTAPANNGGTAITDYTVQYSSNSGSTWNTFADGTSTATSATVTGLTNGTAYTFRVAAVNSVGTGAYSPASASVTPEERSFIAEYLIVAGGGGLGAGAQFSNSAAGGAGGLLQGTRTLAAGATVGITVGAGGVRGQNGQNSVFDGLTAVGGGRGGTGHTPGASGGSGGGAQFGAGGAGTAGQGFAGANYNGVGGESGGGGGAGGPGNKAYYYEYDGWEFNEASGAGGPGLSVSITGSPVVYAAGGDVSNYVPALPQNTGGGGGGSTGVTGRNGIVVLAYQGPPLASISAGLTYTHSTSSRPGWNVYQFTGGTGTITP